MGRAGNEHRTPPGRAIPRQPRRRVGWATEAGRMEVVVCPQRRRCGSCLAGRGDGKLVSGRISWQWSWPKSWPNWRLWQLWSRPPPFGCRVMIERGTGCSGGAVPTCRRSSYSGNKGGWAYQAGEGAGVGQGTSGPGGRRGRRAVWGRGAGKSVHGDALQTSQGFFFFWGLDGGRGCGRCGARGGRGGVHVGQR